MRRASLFRVVVLPAVLLAGPVAAEPSPEPGPDGPAAAAARGRELLAAGDWKGARVQLERALALREAAGDPDSLAAALIDLARLEMQERNADAALALSRRALEIRAGRSAPDSPATAAALAAVGASFSAGGDADSADAYLTRALEIRERVLPPDDPDRAGTLYALGQVRLLQGRYEDARVSFERAVRIREADPRGPTLDLAAALNGLGLAWKKLGRMDEAIPLYRRAIDTAEETGGPDHPWLAQYINNLAGVYWYLGSFEEALALQQRSLAIRERTLAPEHPDVGQAWRGIALIYEVMDRQDESDAAFAKALAILEPALGSTHPDVIGLVSRIGSHYADTGRPDVALPYSRRALRDSRAVLGPDHPDTGDAEYALGRVLLESGRPAEAADHLREALRIVILTRGEDAPEVAYVRLDLARAARASGDVAAALDELLAAEANGRRHLQQTMVSLSEDEALAYENVRARGIDGALRILAAPEARTADRIRRVWDAVVRSRAVVLDTRILLRNGRMPAEESPVLDPDGRGVRPVVAAGLPPGAAIVSYVVSGEAPRTLLAFVLSSADAPARCVVLGPVEEVDAAVDAWRGSIGGSGERVAGESLRRRVWDPVAAAAPGLSRADLVLLVPAGSLNLVSLAALPVGEDRYLIETMPPMHVVSAERDLFRPVLPPAPGGLLALGDPDFDADPTARVAVDGVPGGARGRLPCPDLDTVVWDRLPASAEEAREVMERWRGRARNGEATGSVSGGKTAAAGPEDRLLLGGEATESAFRALAPGRRVIHVATHGLFRDGTCGDVPAGARGIGGLVSPDVPAPVAVPEGDVPLLSGLVLAGANRHRASPSGEEDGILTAEEVATLPLEGVEWVVLSACETGVGTVRGGEGVFGLRRAFRVAGARTLLLSLRPVEDADARDWMRRLYDARFGEGLSTAESVRRASLAMLEDARARGEVAGPARWGAFVAAGDWR